MKNNSAEPKKKANKIYSNIGLKLLSVVLGFLVCSMGLQKGVERITKVMMVCLLTIMVVLCNLLFGPSALVLYLCKCGMM